MPRYTLQDKRRVGANGLLLNLQPVSGQAPLRFEPGQYVTVGFRRDNRRTPVRSFSIVSAPHEPLLQVAMRVEGNFSRAFSDVEPGDVVYVQGPFGDFVTDPRYDHTVVLLAGGIGVTPFVSMLRHATETNSPISFTLLFSNHSQTDIPFYDELVQLSARNPRIRVVFFVTDGQTTPGTGVTMRAGHITAETLEQLTGGQYRGITYFICGPKGFTHNLSHTLKQHDVRNDRIITESFSQSSKLFGSGNPAQTKTYAFATAIMVLAIGGVILLDLIRSVPKLVSAQAAAKPATSTTTTNTTTPSPSTTTTPTTTTPTTTDTTTTTQQPTTTYTSPVSSVS